MIRANTMHRIRTGAGPTIFVLIDPQSPLGISLARAFNKGVAIVLGESSMTQLVSYFSKYLTHHYLDHELETSLTRIIVNSDAAEQPSNGRLKNILSLIKRGEGNTLSIFKNIVMETGLSESRLMHYFKAETGVTIRKYIQWLRIQQALKSIVQGCKINEASSSAGFTDAAHFNRIFVSTFGVNPSTITRATKEASRKRST